MYALPDCVTLIYPGSIAPTILFLWRTDIWQKKVNLSEPQIPKYIV